MLDFVSKNHVCKIADLLEKKQNKLKNSDERDNAVKYGNGTTCSTLCDHSYHCFINILVFAGKFGTSKDYATSMS